jgi:hypothetical protein
MMVAVLVTTMTMGAAACSDDSGGKATSTTTVATAATDASDASDATSQVVVTNAGSDPKRQLRLSLRKGQSYEQTNTITQTIDVAIGAQTQHLDQQVTTVTKMIVKDVDGNRFTIAVVFEDIQGTGAGTADTLSQLKGVGWTMVLDDRGAVVDVTVDDSKVTSAVVQQVVDSTVTSVRRSAFVLPVEPVGVGATWTSDSTVLSSGIPLHIAQTATLTGFDGDTILYSVVASYSKGEGDYQVPNLPAGAIVADAEIGGNSTGTGTLSPTSPVPNITTDSNLDVALTVAKGAQLGVTVTKLSQKVTSSVKAL